MSNPIIELFKNRKFQISKRCENLKSNNMQNYSKIQKVQIFKRCENVKKIYAAFENNKYKQKILFEKII